MSSVSGSVGVFGSPGCDKGHLDGAVFILLFIKGGPLRIGQQSLSHLWVSSLQGRAVSSPDTSHIVL